MRKREELEEQVVHDLARRFEIGFGRLMQIGEKLWREHLIRIGCPPGGEFTIGPCAAFMVRCQCVEESAPELDENGHCDWCCGAQIVTKYVREVQKQLRVEVGK